MGIAPTEDQHLFTAHNSIWPRRACPQRSDPGEPGKHVGLRMPLVPEIAHDESVIESDTTRGKHCLVREGGRLDQIDGKWPNPPAFGLKPNAIETATIVGDGVANAPTLKVGGRRSE